METQNFNQNGIGLDNGHFIGLPYTEKEAKLVVISVPWDVTVSYKAGTASGPQNVLRASLQLDLMQHGIQKAWNLGIFVRHPDTTWQERNDLLRSKSSAYISFLEDGGELSDNAEMQNILAAINSECLALNDFVYQQSKDLIKEGKIAAVLGGEHSAPLGLLKALKEVYNSYGVLQIDAHMDLRYAYEGFTYSHASIFNTAISEAYLDKLVQVGIRDYCEEEFAFAEANNVSVFYDEDIKANAFEGRTWQDQCNLIVSALPQNVYISFDIDGLQASLCPDTGTPVAGGLQFEEAVYLIKQVVQSGRKIIGFDLCEVGGTMEWDGNVGARVLYALSNWTGRSQGLI